MEQCPRLVNWIAIVHLIWDTNGCELIISLVLFSSSFEWSHFLRVARMQNWDSFTPFSSPFAEKFCLVFVHWNDEHLALSLVIFLTTKKTIRKNFLIRNEKMRVCEIACTFLETCSKSINRNVICMTVFVCVLLTPKTHTHFVERVSILGTSFLSV